MNGNPEKGKEVVSGLPQGDGRTPRGRIANTEMVTSDTTDWSRHEAEKLCLRGSPVLAHGVLHDLLDVRWVKIASCKMTREFHERAVPAKTAD